MSNAFCELANRLDVSLNFEVNLVGWFEHSVRSGDFQGVFPLLDDAHRSKSLAFLPIRHKSETWLHSGNYIFTEYINII
jgi:hypothetical protein